MLLITAVNAVFPLAPFSFTSEPVVFDNGTQYSVAFSTGDDSTAYIEYERMGKRTAFMMTATAEKTAVKFTA